MDCDLDGNSIMPQPLNRTKNGFLSTQEQGVTLHAKTIAKKKKE